MRTIISGWGHATPLDPDGRPCAEWCFRTHKLKLGDEVFDHYMGPIGCADNPIKAQRGNWEPDRAGWCPGMAVPVRVDEVPISNAGKSVNYEYDYEDWTTDGGTASGNKGAYYATSCYAIVKSNSRIDPAVVTD